MTNWDSLKAGFAFGVLPGNVEHIGMRFACPGLETLQLILIGARRLTVNPGLVRENRLFFRQDPIDCLKTNVSLRRAAARRERGPGRRSLGSGASTRSLGEIRLACGGSSGGGRRAERHAT